MLPAPTPGTPSIRAVWMPWKWIVCGWSAALTNRIRRRSPSRARSVGPGTRPLYAHAAYLTPGATSISFSSATSSHSRTPPRTTPSSKSRSNSLRIEAVGRVIHGADGSDVRMRVGGRVAVVLRLGRDRLGGRDGAGDERQPAEKVST